jgi:hypothetical protein
MEVDGWKLEEHKLRHLEINHHKKSESKVTGGIQKADNLELEDLSSLYRRILACLEEHTGKLIFCAMQETSSLIWVGGLKRKKAIYSSCGALCIACSAAATYTGRR